MRLGRYLLAVSCGIAFSRCGCVVGPCGRGAAVALPLKAGIFVEFRDDLPDSQSRGSRWELLLMQFEPESAHDGYEVVASQELPAGAGRASGTLAPGRYFAVAMYRGDGGHWICPGYAEDKDRPAGAVSRICYGEDSPLCPVTLTVLSAAPAGAPSH